MASENDNFYFPAGEYVATDEGGQEHRMNLSLEVHHEFDLGDALIKQVVSQYDSETTAKYLDSGGVHFKIRRPDGVVIDIHIGMEATVEYDTNYYGISQDEN